MAYLIELVALNINVPGQRVFAQAYATRAAKALNEMYRLAYRGLESDGRLASDTAWNAKAAIDAMDANRQSELRQCDGFSVKLGPFFGVTLTRV